MTEVETTAVRPPRAGPPERDELAARAARLLRETPPGSGLTGDDLVFMFNLLLRHPDAERKIGAGVGRVTVERSPRFPTRRMFVVHRLDGTSDDFSYRKCLAGREPSATQQVLGALRLEVQGQILSFRARKLSAGARFCPHTRETLPGNNPHVHHAFAPFITVALRFIALEGGIASTGLEPAQGGGRRLRSRDQARRWRVYHARASHLRLVSRGANTGPLRADPELDERPAFCTFCGAPAHHGACP